MYGILRQLRNKTPLHQQRQGDVLHILIRHQQIPVLQYVLSANILHFQSRQSDGLGRVLIARHIHPEDHGGDAGNHDIEGFAPDDLINYCHRFCPS